MRLCLFIALLLSALPAAAHQPVQDMAPRWSGGYGFQIRHEYWSSDDFLDGSSDRRSPVGQKSRVHTTWLEGVYTFDRSIRVTAKVPWIDQERVSPAGIRQSGRGLGDIVLGVPLKAYWNEGGETGNWSFTPSVRLPTGSTSDSFPTGDGSFDFGASFSYSRETPSWYELVDLFYWNNRKGKRGIDQGDVFGVDVNLGIHPYHDNNNNSGVFLMWDLSARYETRGSNGVGISGGKRVHSGPVVVGYWENYVVRAELKLPVYERVWSSGLAQGPLLNVLVGVTF